MRADRIRAKKKSHKLSERQVQWIRDQQEVGLSTRETARAFKAKYHGIHSINASTVCRIWKKNLHDNKVYCSICNAAKGKPSTGGLPFTIVPDRCDPCHKIFETARTNASERRDKSATRRKILEEIGKDPDLELIDLPHYLRKHMCNDPSLGLNKGDMIESSSKRLRTTGDAPDPSVRETERWFGSVYAIHFIGKPELANFVYVGQTTQGVLKRFAGHLQDAKNPERASSGTPYFQKLLAELDRTDQLDCVRLQLLDNLVYGPDVGHKEEFDEKERTHFLELTEQKWQKRFFLAGHHLLNASFKIQCAHPQLQDIQREDILEYSKNPEKLGVADLSNIGHGYYGFMKDLRSSKGIVDAWQFYTFTDEGVERFTDEHVNCDDSSLPAPDEVVLEEPAEMPVWLL
tara:strand:- start:448 stop:1656 length:1209 start_codon:yes stop_codon:yes gene_type:complete